ncbi:MAG TPA: hypothetical protein VH092_00080, partial [Urbifossiella sp.]|nr:hypothetical protein [Urbifossiella sp.]
MPALLQSRNDADQTLRARLEFLSESDKEFWAFRGNSRRGHAHAFFQYPAMMVPQMQRALIQAVSTAKPALTRAFDPYVGSGTTLTESMLHGLPFAGWDINPLAILLCQAKSGPFHPKALATKLEEVMGRVAADRSDTLETTLPNVKKWFRRPVRVSLSRLRRAIRSEPTLWARRFFWVALADAVRLTSNSRTSTFKLHIREDEELRSRRVSPKEVFRETAVRNIEHLQAMCADLTERGLLTRGRYERDIQITLRDATRGRPVTGVSPGHDLLLSSPPYGDNKSTVPYGQYSYLPLNWIDGTDIVDTWDETWLRTTHEIDTRSLGGVIGRGDPDTRELCSLSPAFQQVEAALRAQPRDRLKRVAAFCRDLNNSLGPILGEMRDGAYLIWTVGNRRV